MQIALKEWAVILNAMKQGLHHILLRKGGLADKGQTFRVEYPKFFLFPTYEHQQKEMTQKKHQTLYDQTVKGMSAENKLLIDSWAEVKESFEVKEFSMLKPLSTLHVWSDSYLQMRLNYKPEKPLYLLLLRIYRLTTPKEIEKLERYGGCRSWVELDETISTEGSIPVISDDDFSKVSNSLNNSTISALLPS